MTLEVFNITGSVSVTLILFEYGAIPLDSNATPIVDRLYRAANMPVVQVRNDFISTWPRALGSERCRSNKVNRVRLTEPNVRRHMLSAPRV